MGASKRYSPIRGRMLRITKVDACGRVIYGDNAQVVSKGFITVNLTANVETGDAVQSQNANGEYLVNEPGKPSFGGYGVEITFGQVDPWVYALATGQVIIEDPQTGEAIGFGVDDDVDIDGVAFALEVWTGVPQVECSDTGQGVYGYFLLPFVRGAVFGDVTIENAPITFTLTNGTTKGGSGWAAGPYDVMLGATGQPGPLVGNAIVGTRTHLRSLLVEVAPPTDAAGAYPVLDPANPVITNFTATAGGGNTVNFAPTPAGTDPMVYDFGDNTWDYDADGTVSHTYSAPGTYTVKASRGLSTITKSITVPVV